MKAKFEDAFTDKQLLVYRLRKKGLKLKEIGKKIGSTVSAVRVIYNRVVHKQEQFGAYIDPPKKTPF